MNKLFSWVHWHLANINPLQLLTILVSSSNTAYETCIAAEFRKCNYCEGSYKVTQAIFFREFVLGWTYTILDSLFPTEAELLMLKIN